MTTGTTQLSIESIKLGLDRIAAAAEVRGHPERATRFVHIAGTNGKGSVATMLESVLRAAGYRTGQFGKNHLGDLDEHLPSNHGFDEFYGNLYHLNAEEEPEHPDYPGDMVTADGRTFREAFGPRGVIHSYGDGRIEDTGPLTQQRMESVDAYMEVAKRRLS